MSRALDTYPALDGEQMRRFRWACKDEGVDPKDRCPLCRGRRLTKETRYQIGETHSWERSWLAVACHSCRVQYGVVLRRESIAVVPETK